MIHHYVSKCLFALVILSIQSCQKRALDCVYEVRQCECVWINDTDKNVTIKWFYSSEGKDSDDSVRISAGEKYVRMDWYNHRMLYNANQISFSFSGKKEYKIENPNRIINGGLNWWDSLPNSTHQAGFDNQVDEIKVFYLSDVLKLAVTRESTCN